MKHILFITWDSDQTNYLESLFFPIFRELGKRGDFKFSVAQFSWAKDKEVKRLRDLASSQGISYFWFKVNRKPHALIGSAVSVYQNLSPLKKLILDSKIDAIMPRSTMPAFICNRMETWLEKWQIPISYDYDGFALQERVDFSGRNPKGLVHEFFFGQEKKLLRKSKVILTRSKRAKELLLLRDHGLKEEFIYPVSNGRDTSIFDFSQEARDRIRKELGFEDGDQIWIYSGSLGVPYAFDELFEIVKGALKMGENVYLLVLSRNSTYLKNVIPEDLKPKVKIVETDFLKVADYLSAGDLGISLRKPAPSLVGLFPIKLGEYLLTGLPVLASIQVGDTQEWVGKIKGLIGVDLTDPEFAEKAYYAWKEREIVDRKAIRISALDYFSLERAVRDYENALMNL